MEEKGAFTFIWKIENFRNCLQSQNECLCVSPSFIFNSDYEAVWEIKLYKKGPDVLLKLLLTRLRPKWTQMYAIDMVYQLSLMNIDGALLNEKKEKMVLELGFEKEILPHPTIKEVCDKKRSAYLPQDTLTVFCRLWRALEDMGEDVLFFARTRIGIKSFSKVWAINEFSKLLLQGQISTTVLFAGMEDSQLTLKVASDGIHEKRLKIVIHSTKPSHQSFMCKISVLDQHGKSVKQICDEHTFLENQLAWTFPNFISYEELNAKKKDLLPQDTLCLKLEFTLSIGVKYEEIESTHYGLPRNLRTESNNQLWNLSATSLSDVPRTTELSESRSSLNSDLLSLYQEKTLSDFKLKAEDVTFPVHKSILCARSPVFKSMLTSDMQEGDSKSINVPDVDADTMERMLLYVYTDVFDNMELESVLKLYYAADKYGILPLKQKCCLALKSHLRVQNACVILSLADRHRDEELTSAVHLFILNHDEEVFKSTEWTEFETENSQLATTTMCVLYKKKLNIV